MRRTWAVAGLLAGSMLLAAGCTGTLPVDSRLGLPGSPPAGGATTSGGPAAGEVEAAGTSGGGAGLTPVLTHKRTHLMPQGTHRPEVLVAEKSQIIVVVVEPSGPPGVGQVKHRAYRYDANWNRIGEPFAVTTSPRTTSPTTACSGWATACS